MAAALALAGCGAPAPKVRSADVIPESTVVPVEVALADTAPSPALPTLEATARTPGRPTVAPTASPTAAPAASPTASPAAATAAPAVPPGAAFVLLPGVAHTWQKWNNCGPSASVMAMSAFGVHVDQLVAAASLKPDREDTNVAPDEIAAYVRGQGLEARVRYGAERDRLRALLRAGAAVIVEHWVSVEGRGEMGHYRVLVGYDDATAEFVAADSYYGANRRYGYDAVEAMGRPFLGVYVAVFRADQSAAVDAALNGDDDDEAMWSRVGADVDAWSSAHPDDAWAWYAEGELRARRGDGAGAVAAFDRARAIGLPFRAFWYQFGYAKALFDTGAYGALIAQADATLETMHGENLEEWHVWRGRALQALGRQDEARAAFERALTFHAGFAPAVDALGGAP